MTVAAGREGRVESLVAALVLGLAGCGASRAPAEPTPSGAQITVAAAKSAGITGTPACVINGY
jgi:hypothetical protein